MITAGIDCGVRNVKVVIFKDSTVLARAMVPTEADTGVAANGAYDQALSSVGIARVDIDMVFATGAGRKGCDFSEGELTEVMADAKGISFLMPSVRTFIDIGAEEGRVVRIDYNGTVVRYTINDKCAAGAGILIERTARMLETTVEKMAELYGQSTREVALNAHCVVFAETELISLVHTQTARPDIARAVISAVGDKTVSMLRRVGAEKDVAAVGGVSLNRGFIKSIEKEMNISLLVPDDPQFVGALGAAVAAAELKRRYTV